MCSACPEGRYGVDCMHLCRCENSASCNHVDGNCSCTAGWTGSLCQHRTFSHCSCTSFRGVDPYGTGGHVPPILMKGDIHRNVPTNILEVMSFRMSTRVTATVVCCILTQILCVVSQKSFSFSSSRPHTGAPTLDHAGGLHPPDPLPGFHPWTPLGTSVPQAPSFLLCPPNNPVRSTPLTSIVQSRC